MLTIHQRQPAMQAIGLQLADQHFDSLFACMAYPVYYAPRLDTNYFFYDGMYWIYQDDYWYTSNWYNGPWQIVEPEDVPLFILRIPVRYYQYPPAYFRGWRPDAPPRWGDHWGREWEQHRRGWDRWKHSAAPARAPLPVYQRQYSGDRYPKLEQQQLLRREHYRYQPRDKAVRQQFQQQREQREPVPVRQGRQEAPHLRGGQQDIQRQAPPRQGGPVGPGPQSPHQAPLQQRAPIMREQKQPEFVPHERQAPRPQGQEQRFQEKERPQEPRGQGQKREEEHGR